MKAKETGLIMVNMQETILQKVECSCEVFKATEKLLKGLHPFQLPTVVAAQEGFGEVIGPLLALVEEPKSVHMKSSFSAYREQTLKATIDGHESVKQWIVVGLEAHISVLQTARDLKASGVDVAVANDCIASRSLYDYSSAIAEMRDLGVRITTAETLFYDLLEESRSPLYEEVAALSQ